MAKMSGVRDRDREAALRRVYNSDFLTAYLETALWSSTAYPEDDDDEDAEGVPMDDLYDIEDIQTNSLWYLIDYAEDWLESDDVQEALDELGEVDESQLGCDLWLTAAGHGAGFWDGDWPEPAASILTKTSKPYGVELYDAGVGDAARVYASGGEDYKG